MRSRDMHDRCFTRAARSRRGVRGQCIWVRLSGSVYLGLLLHKALVRTASLATSDSEKLQKKPRQNLFIKHNNKFIKTKQSLFIQISTSLNIFSL